jgi:hypothetical protein
MVELRQFLRTAQSSLGNSQKIDCVGSDGESGGDSIMETDRDYGSDLGIKEDNIYRCCCLNIGNLPADQLTNYKQTNLFQHIRNLEADTIGMSKIGLNWPNLSAGCQWGERSRGQFEIMRSILAFNSHDTSRGKIQWGGTGLITRDSSAL